MKGHVKLSDIHKSFNHIKALDGATLEAMPGEVLAIVGDNGAGKSTLIKILSGVLQPDAGSIQIGDKEFHALTVNEAIAEGISTVYQDLSLGNTMDVAANIFLGHEILQGRFLDKKEMHVQAEKLLRDLDIDIPDTHVTVGDLSGGQRQGIAVARLVHQGGETLIFDEPTAAMGVVESEKTLKLIRSLADRGMTVFLICHNLAQVFQIADRVAVMRHGQVVLEEETSKLSAETVVKLLTSSDILEEVEKTMQAAEEAKEEGAK